MNDVQIRVHVEIRGESVEDIASVPRSEWESMTPAQRRKHCEEFLDQHIANEVPAGWAVLGADEGSEDD